MYLAEAWELYCSNVLASSSRRAIVTETGRWNNHVVPYLENRPVSSLNSLDILRIKAALFNLNSTQNYSIQVTYATLPQGH